MKKRSKVQLSLIANETSRRATFRKRKRGMMKKLNELVTLCGIKACAVIQSPYESTPEVWPSREGVEEVVSRFKDVPMIERRKKMADQESYTWDMIKKGREQVKKLQDENREYELKEFMFDCLDGTKMIEYHYDAKHNQDLPSFVDHYLNELNRRIEILTVRGESSSSTFPPLPHDVSYVNQQEPVQYQAPADYDHQIQHRAYDMMNSDLIHNMSMNSDHHYQYPNPQQPSFMDLLMGQPQEMGSVKDLEIVPFMEENYSDQQLTTDHMSSITATVTTDVFPPNINGSLW